MECSLKPILSPYDGPRPVDWARSFGRTAPVEVEIGFGMGEVLMQKARDCPGRNYVGIEQHWERVYKTLKAITRQQSGDGSVFQNIRILNTDAHVVFERLFDEKSIDSVYCLFPCPWPKKAHAKHRLFSHQFLRLLNSRLKKGGTLQIVTDFYPYQEWIVSQSQRTGFLIETKTVSPKYNTKFEKKWKEEGQERFFGIDFVKKRHIHVPLKKDARLKSYTVNHFDADRLHLADVKGKESVIFKDFFFDPERNKAMIHAVVAEEHLTQHFWITIVKKNNTWRIARAEGQNFLPTAGIARALALVHKAASQAQ